MSDEICAADDASLARQLGPGTRTCQCAARGTHFDSDGAFALHRVGDWDHGGCLAPAEMRARGLELNGQGCWTRARHTVALGKGEPSATPHDCPAWPQSPP